MAEMVSTATLSELLRKSERAGASFAWIDRDRGLVTGKQFGQPDFWVDLGQEKLRRLLDEPSARSPLDQSAPSAGGGLSHRPIAKVDGYRRSLRATGRYSFSLEGTRHDALSQKALLLTALEALERFRPGTMEKLSREKGRTKRIVSQDRMSLSDDAALAHKHSTQISGGWWVLANNSFPEAQKFIRRAAWHAGAHVEIEKLA